jgi:CubicO group peptidase (beta-lactamase class C family)
MNTARYKGQSSSVTSPKDVELDEGRLARLGAAIEEDLAGGRYLGANIIVARHGAIGFRGSFGVATAERIAPLREDAVFSIFSMTKAFTNLLVFRAIEHGCIAMTTRVSTLIPGFRGGLREALTVYHLLTHTSGLPPIFVPKPGMYIDRLDEVIAAICEVVHAEEEPGVKVNYSPMVAHALLGEMVRRVDPLRRTFRQIAAQELFDPLGMRDTWIGVRADLRSRKIVPFFLPTRAPMQHLGHSNLGENGAFEEEDAEMPWVGAVSTIDDMFLFAEMLRRGGELNGERVVSNAFLERAITNHTGDKPNELYKKLALARGWRPAPAYIGLGFSLRGDAIVEHQFGTLTSPGTFGNYGAGSMIYWIDPDRDLTFVAMTTGVMHECDNIERFQRLSDIAVSAAN